MPYQIIYYKDFEEGNFRPIVRSGDNIKSDQLIGLLYLGHIQHKEIYSDCSGKVISVFQYQDFGTVIKNNFPLCLVLTKKEHPHHNVNISEISKPSNKQKKSLSMRKDKSKRSKKTWRQDV